jgi:TRAP-type uncharacterized transport system fused permease subunit
MPERLACALVRARLAHGQTAAEYVGVLLVVSAIIVGVATTGLGHDITQKLSELVRDIAGGDTPAR